MAGYVARVWLWSMSTDFWLNILRERDHFKELSVDGRVILKFIFVLRT
jgi:hypothetical protein